MKIFSKIVPGESNCFKINENKGEKLNKNCVYVNNASSTSGINSKNLHNKNMNYYQDIHTNTRKSNYGKNNEIYNYNNKPIIQRSSQNSITSNDIPYDQDYDMEINQFLDEAEMDCLAKDCNDSIKNNETKFNEEGLNYVREQFEDYYDDFFEDSVDDHIPEWYNQMLQNKIKETKSRLEILSTLVFYTCISNSTKDQINRIENDHNSPFCKLDYPRHPSFSKAWQNYWRFNCISKCKINPLNPNHIHTSKCEIVLEHVKSGITTKSDSITPNEFPSFVMHAVESFQEFITCIHKDSNSKTKGFCNFTTWSYIKLRSNYKNELMLIAAGKNITPFLKSLTSYFKSGPGRSCNVVSLYCINEKWSQKKQQPSPLFLTGCIELRDKIGPITIKYTPKTNISFNSIQAHLLGKIILDYLSPNMETTLIDIGCNYGVLGLMLAHKCDKVIGLYTLEHQIKMAEEIKSYNNLHNISFIVCNPKEVHTKCSSLIKKCTSVAVLNLASPFGKSFDAIQALRNLPSVWRVVVYGSFKKEFHKYISVLTSKNESLGDEFLPMQGSILDKSPSDPDEYDIIILFERKALIEPIIELIAPGPTVNIKADIDNSWTFVGQCKSEKINTVKVEKALSNFDHHTKNMSCKPFLISNNLSQFDSSSVLQGKDLKPNTTSQLVEQYDQSLSLKFSETHDSQIYTHTNIKDSERILDCPSSSNSKKILSDYRFQSKSNENQLNYMLPLNSYEKQFEYSQMTEIDRQFNYLPVIKCEKDQLNNIDLPKNNQVGTNQIVKVKIEPLEKEDGELSPETINTNTHVSSVIKSEPINLNNESNNAFIKYEALLENDSLKSFNETVIKMEPLSSNETVKVEPTLSSSMPIKIEPNFDNNEPMDMKISPISDEDIENMVTPISVPAALARAAMSPLPPISTNFTTIDGFQLFVKPNESFLSYKADSDANDHSQKTAIDTTQPLQSLEQKSIKKEKHEFIKEKTSNGINDYKSNNMKIENKIPIKEDLKKSNDNRSIDTNVDHIDPDLRMLIEKRKIIKKQLDRNREERKYKKRNDRSPSPIGKKYKSSHSPSDRWNKYSSSSSYRSSYSPNKSSDKKSKSPLSPIKIIEKRYRSPVSSVRTGDRRCKSPISPERSSDRRCRSPLSYRERRCRSPFVDNRNKERSSRLSLSPVGKRFKRSPQSPRYSRSPVFFMERRYRRKSRSQSPFQTSRVRSPPLRRRKSRSRSPLF